MYREPVKSRSIAAVGYNEVSGTLEVEFRNGSLYRYYDVPERIYSELLTASSLGRFINYRIKPYFAYEKLVAEDHEKIRTAKSSRGSSRTGERSRSNRKPC